MENEFQRINMLCDGTYIIPGNAGVLDVYPNELGPNQVCNLFGAQPGQAQVSGRYVSMKALVFSAIANVL